MRYLILIALLTGCATQPEPTQKLVWSHVEVWKENGKVKMKSVEDRRVNIRIEGQAMAHQAIGLQNNSQLQPYTPKE